MSPKAASKSKPQWWKAKKERKKQSIGKLESAAIPQVDNASRKRKRPASQQADAASRFKCTSKAAEYAAAEDGNSDADSGEKEGDAVTELEGIVHGGVLLLLHRATSTVYSSERDAAGQLIAVGSWCNGTVTLTEAVALSGTEIASIPAASPAAETEAADIEYAFHVDQDDHCETCAEAYVHVAPLLSGLAAAVSKTDAKLRIYDPCKCAHLQPNFVSGLCLNSWRVMTKL
jgi:hypothetical protein